MSARAPLCRDPKAAILVLAPILLLPAALAAQSEPPPPLPMEELEFPAFEERTLGNGARVLVVEHREQPFVSINLVIDAGTSSDPRNRVGTAGLTASLLDKGTESRTALEIAEEVDFLGASLGAGAATDWTSVTLGVLTPDLPRGLELLADVVMNPAFPEEELEILRQQALTGLRVQLSQSGAVANRIFASELYGRHPYGNLDTPESLEALSRRDVERFHSTRYRPDGALFVVAGDVSADEIVQRLEAAFGSWRPGAARPPTYFSPPEREAREVVLVHRPGSEQAEIRIGHLLMEGSSEGWIPLQVAVRVLGGGSLGRLFRILREEKGWTYGAYAQAVREKDRGSFRTFMSVRNEVVDSALAEGLRQIEELRIAPPPPARLEEIKGSIVGSFPLDIETPQQIAGQVATYRLMGLTLEDLERYRDRVAALTPEDIHAAAREHIHPSRSLVVVVGDANRIRRQVAGFGDLRMVDVEGERLTLEDIEVRESDIAWDASGLRPGRFVYRVSLQGQPVGEMVRQLNERTVDGQSAMAFTTSMAMPNQSVNQEVVFTTRSFRPLSGSFRVTAQGQEIGMEVEHQAGRIRGTVRGPQGGEREIDREVPAGTLLGDMDELAVWITDLEAQPELRFPVVNLQNAGVSQVRVQVQGTTEITVPAGTFQAWEVELSGGETNQRAYFRREAPHVLLRAETRGQPVVIELSSLTSSGGG